MNTLDVRVAQARMLTPIIRELTLAPVSGRLPSFSAGSHIQLLLDDGARSYRNAYSLLSDPADNSAYRIAVRKQEHSRGGSTFVHEKIEEGSPLRITPPANLFPLNTHGRAHILIAGGIGITPFLAHIAELERRGADYELHYAYRPGLTDAYCVELAAQLGPRFHGYDGQSAMLGVSDLLADRPLASHVYVCGPAGLLAAVRDTSRSLGWPESRVHWEAFVAPAPGRPFTVNLRRSGRSLIVAADQSLLEALEAANIDVPNLCRGGACGQCITPHLEGDVDHRDAFLSTDARATHLMPCVSRARGATLTIDL